MTASEIAEKFAVRPGFRLVDYIEVGLPVYNVVLQASTLLRKKISPLEEFVMRCVQLGMQDCGEISQFLGLDQQFVEGVVSGLVQDNNVCLAGVAESNEQALKLTQKGCKSLEEAETIVPEERTFSIFFDALLRKPALFRERLLKFKDLREQGFREIPSAPPRQPKVNDFPIKEVELLLRQLGGSGEKRDLLTIKRVERCTRLFRYAVALLYRSIDGDEPVVDFVVDSKLSSEYGNAFARADGLRRLGIESAVPSEQVLVAAPDLPPRSALEETERKAIQVQAEIHQATHRLQASKDEVERKELGERLRDAVAKLAEIEAERKLRRVRQVYVYEHQQLLDRALTKSHTRLLIISPWIRAQVIDKEFMDKLRTALRRGVEVYIGYGISRDGDNDRPADKAAEEKLQKLSTQFGNFVFRRLGDTHAKVLICDSTFIVTGSFNWLSFRGDPDRTFRDEQSTLVEIPEHIDEVFREQLKRFENVG